MTMHPFYSQKYDVISIVDYNLKYQVFIINIDNFNLNSIYFYHLLFKHIPR